jgi:hypothetical protein
LHLKPEHVNIIPQLFLLNHFAAVEYRQFTDLEPLPGNRVI